MCPFNIKFAQELKEPSFAARAFIAGKDARTLATDLLALEQADFSAAFRKSPMKRAKRAGLQRNARVVLRKINSAGDPAASYNTDNFGTAADGRRARSSHGPE